MSVKMLTNEEANDVGSFFNLAKAIGIIAPKSFEIANDKNNASDDPPIIAQYIFACSPIKSLVAAK